MTVGSSVLSASIVSATSRAAGWLCSLFITISVLALRGPNDLALFLLVSSGALAGALLDLGACAAFVERCAVGVRGDSTYRSLMRPAIARLGNGVALAMMAFALIVAGLCLSPRYFDLSPWPIIWLAVSFLVTGAGQIIIIFHKIQALELKEYKTGISTLFATTFATLFISVCLKATSMSGDELAAAFTILFWVAQLGGIAVNFGWTRTRDLLFGADESERKRPIEGISSYANKFVMISLTTVVGSTFDMLFIGMLLGPSDVTRFGIAYRVFIGIQAAQLSVNQLWPIVANRWIAASREERYALVSKLYAISGALAVAVASVGAVVVFQIGNYIGNKEIILTQSELIAFFLFSVSSGLGGLSSMLAYREGVISKLFYIQCVWCCAMLVAKPVFSLHAGLSGFLWATVIVNILFFHLPVVTAILRSR